MGADMDGGGLGAPVEELEAPGHLVGHAAQAGAEGVRVQEVGQQLERLERLGVEEEHGRHVAHPLHVPHLGTVEHVPDGFW